MLEINNKYLILKMFLKVLNLENKENWESSSNCLKEKVHIIKKVNKVKNIKKEVKHRILLEWVKVIYLILLNKDLILV